jgi:hypothetical protein
VGTKPGAKYIAKSSTKFDAKTCAKVIAKLSAKHKNNLTLTFASIKCSNLKKIALQFNAKLGANDLLCYGDRVCINVETHV